MSAVTKLKLLFICLLVLTLLSISAYATPDVNLGAAASFGVLGGTTVTNSGNTIINGDLGVWSGSAITGFGPGIVNGATHAGDAVAQQAQSDVTTAYNNLASMSFDEDWPFDGLGSTIKTLTAGVYLFDTSVDVKNTFTLSGPGDFVFQIGSTLTAETGSSVVLTNGADAGNVYWQVSSSATLKSGSTFVGNILALTSIDLDGGTLNGRALARNGAVTIAAAETITLPSTVPDPATIVLPGLGKAVPEPATICLLGLGALSLLRRKK